MSKKNNENKLYKKTICMPQVQSWDGHKGGLFDIKIRHKPKQIRKRISYSFWKPIVDKMSWMPFEKMVECASTMWDQMDRSHKFGTMKQAGYELESMALCLLETKDYEMTEDKLEPVIPSNQYVHWEKPPPFVLEDFRYNHEEECEEIEEDEIPF